MEKVLQEIREERARQDVKWGTAHDDEHFPADWAILVSRYAIESVFMPTADEEFDGPKHRKQMIQAAALAVAAIESYDRQNV